MKRIFGFIFGLIMTLCLTAGFITANADNDLANELNLSLSDIVESNGGEISFKKIDPYYSTYNINRRSDMIDTVGTIDEVLVLSTDSANTTFTFKTHLNRNYLTKYFNIVEWFIVPTNLQTYAEYGITGFADSDFEAFEITIKDVQNPDKYVTFRTCNRPDSNTYRNAVAGRVGANGQSVNGVLSTTIDRNWGCTLKASHVGCFEPVDGVPSGYDANLPLGGFLSLDYETKRVYSVTGANKGERKLVRDLDDGSHMIGTDIPWDGFASEELEVSIRFLNIVSGRKASVAILGFNGVDFTQGEIVDEIAPTVIEKTEFDGTLYGEVNAAMPIMEYGAYDLLDGYINQTTSRVYYNYNKASQQEYTIIDGKFTPDKAGTYYVVTVAKDRFGNEGKLVREIEIKNIVSDMEIALPSEIPAESTMGTTISLPVPMIYGGTVNKNYRVEVLFNGNQVDVNDNQVVLKKQGIYTVRYVVWDYYGMEKYFDYFIMSKLGDKPIVDFPNLPEYVVVGNKVKIPNFKALDYISYGDEVNAIVSYAVKGPLDSEYSTLSNAYFTPKTEGNYNLKIRVAQVNNTSNFIEKEYTLNAIKCNKVMDFFIKNNMQVAELYKNFIFETVGNAGEFFFINAITANNVTLGFNVYDISNESQITIRLKNAQTEENYVDLKIKTLNTKESTLTVNGNSFVISGAIADITGIDKKDKLQALKAATEFGLSYKDGWIYSKNVAVCQISEYENGIKFDQFAGEKVYVETFIESASGATSFEFNDFCGNKDFTMNASDITNPTIALSSIGRIAKIGEVVSFTYSVEDLFDTDCQVDVEITKNGELVANGENGYCMFMVTDFGRYLVNIIAVDNAGNETIINFNINCFDNIAPILTVAENVKTKLKLGKTLVLPTAVVTDNIDSELGYSIYVQKPNHDFLIVTDGRFTPTEKGVWTIYYYAVDSNGNYALQTFYVNVV